MQKISFFGLSGSGKSCYIYAMSHAMMEGVKFGDGSVLNVTCTTAAQMARLHNEYAKMAQGSWPVGTTETTNYDYSSRLKLKKVMDFRLQDYRGGLLDSFDEDDKEEHDNLFQSFDDSCTLLFFVGADTVLKAMGGDFMEDYKIGNLGTIYGEYLDQAKNPDVPILVIISKADMIPDGKHEKVKEYVMTRLQGMFGMGTGITVAITSISLGRNLMNDDGDLSGELIVKPTSGNIHIPILFSLYSVIANRIEESTGRLNAAENMRSSGEVAMRKEKKRNAFIRFFSSNERNIENTISNAMDIITTEKNNLQYCAEALNKIKDYLLKGADLYVDGYKQN